MESSIRAAKRVMTRLADEYADLSPQECLAKALWACNSRDSHHGYSPAQHALGRNPDEWNRLFASKVDGFPIHSQEMVDGGFGKHIHHMHTAEQAFLEHQAQERLSRSEAAGHRPLKSFAPGDLVSTGGIKFQEGVKKAFHG